LNEIESTYNSIKDLDPEVYPEVASKYKRVEALLNMLLDFVYAGKSDMDEIAEIIVRHRDHNEEDNE
jgi:1-aminocyclopropane-1-carboxylate deaminase/D-cysteine desulfhydrase-like pyridoxal-dependent ACC family enzyme